MTMRNDLVDISSIQNMACRLSGESHTDDSDDDELTAQHNSIQPQH